jgi:serine/threonine protein kinase
MPFNFGGYRILSLLGKGGMGAVYEAEDLETGRRVALKALGHSLDSPETRKRFLREGRLAASINHPNSVYFYGTQDRRSAGDSWLRHPGPCRGFRRNPCRVSLRY